MFAGGGLMPSPRTVHTHREREKIPALFMVRVLKLNVGYT
jgi:copper homeostasis protein CutC